MYIFVTTGIFISNSMKHENNINLFKTGSVQQIENIEIKTAIPVPCFKHSPVLFNTEFRK